jgi:hypothetical protein
MLKHRILVVCCETGCQLLSENVCGTCENDNLFAEFGCNEQIS